ncbi:RnfH family protein [Methylophaga sp. OBS3]|uniref:RnfH family protein n=1 Tax=Methylophaga sp. OBS3 TaxID=2991934 RepID=UPI0022589D02|nr:RnfH family protein [Methylophaga sp. OBS3]MCX4189382.1 RnfH family protein [Methylophaga sp. OBS3]
MAEQEVITVEVAYALPDEQQILSIEISPETTVEEAIKRSGILERYPQIDLSSDKVGIFGKICKLNATLHHKDRIEIYRGLIADPKESRRQKAEMEKKKKAEQAED